MRLPPDYAIDTGPASVSPRRDTVEIPVFWIVLLLSVLVHVALLYFLPVLRFPLRPGNDLDTPLAVELQPRPPAPRSPDSTPQPEALPPVASAPRSAPAPRIERPQRIRPPVPPSAEVRPAPARPSAPPVLADRQAPEAKPPFVAERTTPERVEPPSGGDLSSYIEARRRARGSAAPAAAPSSAEPQPLDEEARRDRIVARNLGLDRTPSFGGPPRAGGGMFQVTRLNYGSAEFVFYGWNRDIRRNTSQVIEVRKGEHSTIELAVVRRIIAIIREYESGDFVWESTRLGRDVTLSARPGDNAGLEDFLMREFFNHTHRHIGSAAR